MTYRPTVSQEPLPGYRATPGAALKRPPNHQIEGGGDHNLRDILHMGAISVSPGHGESNLRRGEVGTQGTEPSTSYKVEQTQRIFHFG